MSTLGHSLASLQPVASLCRRHPILAILSVPGIGIVAALAVMFLAWEREHEAFECVYAIGGRVGSIGARPFPQEYSIWFPDPEEVQDEDLRRLSGLCRVRMSSHVTLNLRETRITDEGIEYLAALDTVDVFSIGRTGVSDNGVKKLHAARPNARILYSDE